MLSPQRMKKEMKGEVLRGFEEVGQGLAQAGQQSQQGMQQMMQQMMQAKGGGPK